MGSAIGYAEHNQDRRIFRIGLIQHGLQVSVPYAYFNCAVAGGISGVIQIFLYVVRDFIRIEYVFSRREAARLKLFVFMLAVRIFPEPRDYELHQFRLGCEIF